MIPAAPATAAARPFRFVAFTKPWKIGLPELGRKIAALGFDGIELPVRPGYPVHSDNVTDALPRAARLLKNEFGLTIESVAGPTNTATVAACCEAGVNLIRICPAVGKDETYGQAEARLRSEWRALVPFLDDHGVAIGVQNHSDRFVPPSALGLVRLLDGFDPKHVCAVWDAAHEALNGWEPDLALDVLGVGPRLRLLNLKNAVRRQRSENGPRGEARWETYWTAGKDGLASWPRVADELQRRGWTGTVCLTAEYSDESAVERLLAQDIAFARSLFSPSRALGAAPGA